MLMIIEGNNNNEIGFRKRQQSYLLPKCFVVTLI